MKIVLLIISLSIILLAKDVSELARELSLYPGSKASIQWKRIFKSEKRLIKYKLIHLSPEVRNQLEEYLIDHAADSEQPIVPGL